MGGAKSFKKEIFLERFGPYVLRIIIYEKRPGRWGQNSPRPKAIPGKERLLYRQGA